MGIKVIFIKYISKVLKLHKLHSFAQKLKPFLALNNHSQNEFFANPEDMFNNCPFGGTHKGPICASNTKELCLQAAIGSPHPLSYNLVLMLCKFSGSPYLNTEFEVADIIMLSWRESTNKQHNVYISQWMQFCSEMACDPMHLTVSDSL